MSIVCALEDFCPPESGCAVALGFFDGVHKGHQRILSRVVQLAAQAADGVPLQPVAYTFINHPAQTVHPQSRIELLSTPEERWQRISDFGLQAVAEPFDAVLANWEPQEFWQRKIVENLRAKAVVCGANYSFGRGASGTPPMLLAWGQAAGIQVEIVSMAEYGGEPISSSRLRQAVRLGRMREVTDMLGCPFAVTGVVERGNCLGRRWGFPTANIPWPAAKMLPPLGAYACIAELPDGRKLPAVGYLGSRPTLREANSGVRLEVNIGSWQSGRPYWRQDCYEDDSGGEYNLYGKLLVVRFMEFLAPQECFAGLEQLRERIHLYRQLAKSELATLGDVCKSAIS
ncbi:MAG: riboflavin kinase [bacterium]|nr:riboflavin kinase [bacterium]